MENTELLLKNLTGKDETKAKDAAEKLINNADIALYKALVNKADYLFDFVLNNVCKRITGAVNKNNYKNIIKFFGEYSPCFDDLFAEILSKYANEDLTDEIFEILEKGDKAQKAYAAKYFCKIPDTIALEILCKYAFSDDEALSVNTAEALGKMEDDISYDIALNLLKSDDDFDKLKAVKFFVSYGVNYPLREIFAALRTSKMQENIAGQIPYMQSLRTLFHSEFEEDAFYTLNAILSGLGEILPLSEIFNFEIYEILEELIKQASGTDENSGIRALIILSAYSEFQIFTENPEYIFDEDKETKEEIFAIFNLLKSQSKEFYDKQKKNISELLSENSEYFHSATDVISEHKIKECAEKLKELLTSKNEIIVCEALTTLKQLDETKDINIKQIAERIENPNIKAVIESFL